MTTPTFLIRLRNDGTLRVMRSDGDDCTDADVNTFREAIRKHLRGLNIEEANREREEMLKKAYEGDPTQGKRFPIDPLVEALEKERKRRGLTQRSIASAMFIDPTKLTQYIGGWSRPALETVRTWWYVLGFQLLYVPIPLVDQVRKMVDEFITEDTAKREEADAA